MPIVRGEVRANGTHSTSVLTHTAHTPTTIDTAAAEISSRVTRCRPRSTLSS